MNEYKISYERMPDWLSRLGSQRKRRKSVDNFWSEFLNRNKPDNVQGVSFRTNGAVGVIQCQNLNVKFRSSLNYDIQEFRRKGERVLEIDRKEYQRNVFGDIFGKKFEPRAVDSVRKFPQQNYTTYHFCQK